MLDGCSKNPVVSKTKEWASVSYDLFKLVTQKLTHRYFGIRINASSNDESE